MIHRRTVLEGLMASLVGAHAAAAVKEEGAAQVTSVFHGELPAVSLANWDVTAVEVHYDPGVASAAHRHPGFVLGYVLEGSVRFALRGQPERVVTQGQMFYEPPGSVHQVSSNASNDKPARLLALIFAERGATLTRPA